MVQQITQGIKISVKARYEGVFIKSDVLLHAFSYYIFIENQSKDTVQLISRFWKIKDSLNNKKEVKGDGVVGQKPILLSGETHTYTSGCVLCSTMGAMKGHYTLVNFRTGNKIKVPIPLFNLSAPFSMN